MVAAKTLYVTASRNPAAQCILGSVVPSSSWLGLNGASCSEYIYCSFIPGPLSSKSRTHPSLCSRRLLPRGFARQLRKQWRLRGPYAPAHTSRGREHECDARWVGGVLTATAVLREPGGGVAGVPASGHQAPLTFPIQRKTRGSEVRALPTPVTSGPHLNQTSPSDLRPRGGAATRLVDLWEEVGWPRRRQRAGSDSAVPPCGVRLPGPERAGRNSQTGLYAWESLDTFPEILTLEGNTHIDAVLEGGILGFEFLQWFNSGALFEVERYQTLVPILSPAAYPCQVRHFVGPQ